MMLETLFARQNQTVVFLRLVLCGLILGSALDADRAVRHRWPRAAFGADALCAVLAVGLTLPVLIVSGDGVRLYGLLGVCIGLLLYAAGLRTLAAAILRAGKTHNRRKNCAACRKNGIP